MAEIYDRVSSSDQLLILGTRESATELFAAPGWTDLRIGMFLSLCPPGSGHENDPPTVLGETITVSTFSPASYMWIGIKDSGLNLPFDGGGSFIGFSNAPGRPEIENSIILSSDLALGNDSTLWRTKSSRTTNGNCFVTQENSLTKTITRDTPTIHLVQNIATRGYTGLIGFRMTRADPTSNTVTIEIAQLTADSADIAFTNTPNQGTLLAEIDPWPSSIITVGPVTFTNLPNSLFAYWPFLNSRLRISEWIVFQKA